MQSMSVMASKYLMINSDLGQYLEHETPGGLAILYYGMIANGLWCPMHNVSNVPHTKIYEVCTRFVVVYPPRRITVRA
jgi:hypothetical protein